MQLLTTLKTGMQRLRSKGGASPQSLWDLQNGYIDQDGSPTNRPGTEGIARLPKFMTKGLTYFKGEMIVFSHVKCDVPDGFRCVTLRHPTIRNTWLKRVWFAEPFVGSLYVSAEFVNGDVYHYFAVDADTWEAETVYIEGGAVRPTFANGFTYIAGRTDEPGQAWAPRVARQVGDIIEPTVFNGYRYVCIETYGDTPASGDVEPTWPTTAGATVIEETSGQINAAPPTGGMPPPGGVQPPGYTNPGGSRPVGTGTIYTREQ